MTETALIASPKESWYQQLISDLKLLNFEGIVTTKHAIGKRIIEDELKFGKPKYGKKTIENLAQDLDVEKRELYRCIQFVKKYPELEKCHAVTQLSWRKIVNNILPETPHVSQATGEHEWYTPLVFIEAARKVMGSIDCDPASSELANKTVNALEYFTAEMDGLSRPWHGNIWMNPPYKQPLVAEFTETLIIKYQEKEISQAIVLVNNATESKWFQGMLGKCSCLCFPKGRIKFINMEGDLGSPLQGQAILYFGKKIATFRQEFLKFGPILRRQDGPR